MGALILCLKMDAAPFDESSISSHSHIRSTTDEFEEAANTWFVLWALQNLQIYYQLFAFTSKIQIDHRFKLL